MFSQLIQPYLFNPFSNKKIHLLFCNNTSKPPVPFIIAMFPLLFFFFFSKNAKSKAIRKHKLPSHSTNNLKYKMSCYQSSIKAFYKVYLEKRVS